MKYGWLLASWGLLGMGCAHGSTTSGSALVHAKFPYAVSYDDVEHKSVLGEDWRLENYRHRDKSKDIERKKGYALSYSFDFDNDDKGDAKQELPYPDLLFFHRKTSARIEVSTFLLDERLAHKELRVLVQDMIDSRSGTRSLLVGFGRAALGVEKRFATRLLDSSEATLGEQHGLAVTIERVDLDQLQLNPHARWQRSRLFMVHAPFDYFVAEGHSVSSDGKSSAKKFHDYRVLLVAEYTNTPEDFEAQYPDFVRLLDKTHMLSDAMLMSYLGEALSQCKGHADKADVEVAISETGRAQLATVAGIDKLCATAVVAPFAFAGTGQGRRLSTRYDFTLPQKPAWLNEKQYREQRADTRSTETAVAAPEAPAPAPTPSEAEPLAPVPVAPTPAPAPSTAPAPAPSTAPAP